MKVSGVAAGQSSSEAWHRPFAHDEKLSWSSYLRISRMLPALVPTRRHVVDSNSKTGVGLQNRLELNP